MPFSTCVCNCAGDGSRINSLKNFSLEMSWKCGMATFSGKSCPPRGADSAQPYGAAGTTWGRGTREFLNPKCISLSYTYTWLRRSPEEERDSQLLTLPLSPNCEETIYLCNFLPTRVSINSVDGSIFQHYDSEIKHRALNPSLPPKVRRKHWQETDLEKVMLWFLINLEI